MKDLNYSAINVTPVKVDWTPGYGETWEFHAGCRCEKCGKVIIGRGGEKHRDLDHSECEGWVEICEGPMMNYYYPLPEFGEFHDLDECVKAIADLPLCIVEFTETGEYALALTGGGMDLSWEICEAFMRCGYLPPVHFCDLPAMAGRGASARDRRILSACRRSLRGVKARATRALANLKNLAKTATR